jgi:hypothetical protein
VPQIKKALNIGGVYSEVSTYTHTSNDELPSCQIDLLIDRNDHVINVCELIFYKEEYLLTKAYAKDLRAKLTIFKAATKTRKQLFLTLLSTFPIIENQYSMELIDVGLTMEALFEEV